MKKKILSMLLAVLMLVSVLPMSAISAYAAVITEDTVVTNLNVGDIVVRGTAIKYATRMYQSGKQKVLVPYLYVNGAKYDLVTGPYKNSDSCVKITSQTSTSPYEFKDIITVVNACNTNELGNKVSDATCSQPAQYVLKCSYCHNVVKTGPVGSALGHSYTKQGSKVSDATIDSPAIYNKQCATCTATSGTMEVGDKLPAVKVSYTDPITGETVNVVDETTNDNVSDVVSGLMTKPMQKHNQIFTGWYVGDKALNNATTHFNQFTNISANFLEIGPMEKDINDEKMIDSYMTFGLAGVQIRQDNTIELEADEKDAEVYGGLRFVASLSDDIYNNLEIIEYGFVVASKENADKNANGDSSYVIKNGDKNVKRVNCMGSKDHRKFDNNYRLFTMVIDYEESEALKDKEFVARAYIAYRDANGTARIFYNDYDGTDTYGGCSVSYNRAKTM